MNTGNEEKMGLQKIVKSLLEADSSLKHIKIVQNDKGYTLDVYMNVDYGVKIPQVAWDLQESVKKQLADMTDIPVISVNVHVQGVNFPEEQQNEEERES